MNLRITSPSTKIALVVTFFVAMILVSVLVLMAGGAGVGSLVMTGLALAFCVFCARTFRGPSEQVAPPRPGWRLTEKPLAGYLVCVYLVFVASNMLTRPTEGVETWITWICGAAVFVLAALFLRSSVRLQRHATASQSA